MKKLILCALIALVGCADDTIVMRKPGAGQDAEWKKDSYECERDAYTTGDSTVVQSGTYGRVTRDPNWAMYQSCMEARGYKRRY